MATDAELQAALTFGANHSGVSGKTVNTEQLDRIKAWYTATYAQQLEGNAVTADDIAAWMWRQVNAQVTRRENALRDAANELAAVTDLTA